MKKSSKLLIIHFGELWLRGKNRRSYIQSLKRDISERIGKGYQLIDDYDRLLVRPVDGSDLNIAKNAVSKIFGISAYEIASSTSPSLAGIASTAVKVLKECGSRSVKINSHRSYKGFRFNSIDIIKKVAAAAAKAGIEPSLEGFDSELFISVKEKEAFVYTGKMRGSGGLPVGTSGKCVVLLSGGIDSPVAAWYVMKRGLYPIYVHVHGFQSAEEVMQSKIPSIMDMLSEFSPHYKAYLVPSHIFQIAAMRSKRYELVLMKAFMLRLAERIAMLEGAGAIVTGESLGQVASQTLPNITAEQDGIKLPVLRPLIGFDKQEITDIAKKIGTYCESIKPYKDVCSINARSPVTNSNLQAFKSMAKEMGLQGVVSRSLRASKIKYSKVI